MYKNLLGRLGRINIERVVFSVNTRLKIFHALDQPSSPYLMCGVDHTLILET